MGSLSGMNELRARQAALQGEATGILAELDLADLGPVHLAGSYVSGLMVWRDLDVMVFVGPDFTPGDVLDVLRRFADQPDVTGFEYHDERGPRSPTGTVRDERYHVVISLTRGEAVWRIDLTLWLNDPHVNITEWHESLRSTLSDEQRDAILRIKDVWHRRPEYPDEIGGTEIYRAVLEDGVRTPSQFAEWLIAVCGR
jgi:hypothetical protein